MNDGTLRRHPERGMDVTDDRSRRSVLAALGATTAAALAGCLTQGSDPEPTETPTDTPTTTDTTTATDTTEEPTTTEQEDKEFEELYMEEVNEPWVMESGREIRHALNRSEIDKYEDEDRWDSFADKMITLKDEIGGNWSIINDSQEFTRHMQHAVHNDLDYSADEVRVLGRDMAGGGTYTAIMHKNQDGDWVKDLALPFSGEGSYLAHDDTRDDVDFNDEASAGLWNIWDRSDPTTVSATDFITLRNSYEDIDRDDVDESVYEDAKRHVDRGNDHVVVGEPYDETTVDYTVPAAERLTEIQNWHENDTFNEEMAVVEQATEAYHNSEEPYISMEMQNGELTAVPTEEHQGPGTLYEIFDE